MRSLKYPLQKKINNVKLVTFKNVYKTGKLGSFFGELIDNNKIKIQKSDSVLDYGTGTGFLAICAAKKSNHITAIDISNEALQCAKHNAKKNNVNNINFIQSNGFNSIKTRKFNIILAGMPWDNEKPNDKLEHAFYDENFNMRKSLFLSAKKNLLPNGKIYMTYSKTAQEENPIESFIDGYTYKIFAEALIHNEPHYIYEIVKI